MATVNIPQSSIDPHYRYRRNVISVQYLARKGGVTVITNLPAIAKQLGRTEKVLVSYLQKRMNCKITSTQQGWQLAGRLVARDIDDHIETYVEAHVLCQQCGNPETVIEEGKRWCKTCGGTSK